MTSTKRSFHPRLWITVFTVVLFCAAGTTAITKWMPDPIDSAMPENAESSAYLERHAISSAALSVDGRVLMIAAEK